MKKSAQKKVIRRVNLSKRKEVSLGSGLSFLILLPMMLLMLSTVVFLALGMLPTLVSLIFDRNKKQAYKWLCIGGLNFAGCLPSLYKIWFGENSLDFAISEFMSVSTIFIAYGSALIGWVFNRFIPPLTLSFLEMTDQRRVMALREQQKILIEQWGEGVTLGDVKKTK